MSVAVGLKIHKTESMSTLDEFRSLFEAAPTSTFFLSHNGFLTLAPERIVRVKEAMVGHNVELRVYVRDHPSVLVSLYSQAVKKGSVVPDFDTFAQDRWSKISAIPSLLAWGEAFGWTNTTVGSSNGNVVVDYAQAVGLADFLTETDTAARYNSSPSWIWLELYRCAFRQTRVPEGKRGHRRRALRRILDHVRSSAELEGLDLGGATPYLTRTQWRALRDSYNEELAFIEAHTGDVLPPFTEDEPEERPFLPSIETIPRPLAARVSEIVARFPSENDIETHTADSLRKALGE